MKNTKLPYRIQGAFGHEREVLYRGHTLEHLAGWLQDMCDEHLHDAYDKVTAQYWDPGKRRWFNVVLDDLTILYTEGIINQDLYGFMESYID